MRERVYEIHGPDADPIEVPNLNEDGVGVRYTDSAGAQVFVPWHAIDKVVRRVVDDPADEEPEEDPTETEDAGKPVAKKASATKKAAGRKDTIAREWDEGDTDKARAWAKEQNMGVASSGPLPAEVKAAYAAAHSD